MSKRNLERLIASGVLPPKHADQAAINLGIYPPPFAWQRFFEVTLLAVGVVAIAFSLIFFIAFNWFDLGKMGKFALVEGALVLTFICYLALVWLKKASLLQQLLLLAASLITGALLALVGQVYQTGADSWQLFAIWSALIIPWVLIARFPILWLLWLGLINLTVMVSYAQSSWFAIAPFAFIIHPIFSKMLLLTLMNSAAFLAWLIFAERLPMMTRQVNLPAVNQDAQLDHQSMNFDQKKPIAPPVHLHWSTNLVGLLATGFATILASNSAINEVNFANTLLAHVIWLLWLGVLWYHFYWLRLNLLMLTYFCAAIVAVVMVWSAKWLDFDWEMATLFVMAAILLIISSLAVGWLRRLSVASLRTRRS